MKIGGEGGGGRERERRDRENVKYNGDDRDSKANPRLI